MESYIEHDVSTFTGLINRPLANKTIWFDGDTNTVKIS